MVPSPPSGIPPPLRLDPGAAELMRAEIRRAGGREVSFLAAVGEDRMVRDPRAVARGNRSAVLAASREAPWGSLILHNHPTGELEPSPADLAVADQLYEEGVGTAIVDNEVARLYVVVEPPLPRVTVPLDVEGVDALLGPGGPLAARHPAYEDRPGQREMARLAARRYNEGGVGIVEAGTGTGKSMAYLLPAALWALRNGERTVVSTNTINLQEQLAGKDLPLLQELLGEPLRWALVKGRGNYVSIRRARLAAASGPGLFQEDRSRELAALLEWVESTEDGSLADLASPPSEELWEEIQSDADICLRARCPHFQSCFFQRARREAAAAELLVVNHHLLFTDLAVRRATGNYSQAAVLPPYRHLVLDEAHNVEEAATSHLGVEVTRRGLFRLLARLERRGKGILAEVEACLSAHPKRGTSRELRERLERRVRPAAEEARGRLESFLGSLEGAIPREAGETLRLGREGGVEPGERVEVREGLQGLLAAFRGLARELGELRGRIQEDEEWGVELEGRLLDLQGIQNRLEGSARGVRRVLDPGEEASTLVRWLELRRSGGVERRTNLALAAAPLQVGSLLREELFRRLDSTLLTSATLTTRAGFQYLRSRLGLEPEELEEDGGELSVEESVIPTPFDFAARTLLAVPTDLSGPRGEEERFQEETARVVRELAEITGGGLFVLFTSHRALRQVARLLGEGREPLRGPLFVQGEAPRSRLLAGFVASGRGILLGTASFWEGVDVPGEPLRGLILQKLPFLVPTEPVTEARWEALLARGEDPFWRFLLPEAALRLKQGFGRLIRTQEDRGAVLLLDSRILTRRYGLYLRQSLPPAPLVKGPWEEVRRVLEAFYREG